MPIAMLHIGIVMSRHDITSPHSDRDVSRNTIGRLIGQGHNSGTGLRHGSFKMQACEKRAGERAAPMR
jgi:hypothetical protein